MGLCSRVMGSRLFRVQTACDVQSTGSAGVKTARAEQADVFSVQAAGSGLQAAGRLHVAGVD